MRSRAFRRLQNRQIRRRLTAPEEMLLPDFCVRCLLWTMIAAQASICNMRGARCCAPGLTIENSNGYAWCNGSSGVSVHVCTGFAFPFAFDFSYWTCSISSMGWKPRGTSTAKACCSHTRKLKTRISATASKDLESSFQTFAKTLLPLPSLWRETARQRSRWDRGESLTQDRRASGDSGLRPRVR